MQLECSEADPNAAIAKAAKRRRLEMKKRHVGEFDATIERLLDSGLELDLAYRPNGPEAARDGWSLLHHAVHLDHEDRVDWLLDRSEDTSRHSIDPDLPTLVTGLTPLMLAAREGKAALVLKLIDAGADVLKRAANRWTCLHFAAAFGNPCVCKVGAGRFRALDSHRKPRSRSPTSQFSCSGATYRGSRRICNGQRLAISC